MLPFDLGYNTKIYMSVKIDNFYTSACISPLLKHVTEPSNPQFLVVVKDL
jgi:hypothetical protein